MAASFINLKWTWLILAIVCFILVIYSIIEYYINYDAKFDTTTERGYTSLMKFSLWVILPLGIGFLGAFYFTYIYKAHSANNIKKASHAKSAGHAKHPVHTKGSS